MSAHGPNGQTSRQAAALAVASRNLRLVLSVALACGLTWSISQGLGLGSATAYGVVVAALLVRPDFQPNPTPLLVALPLVVVIGLSLGTLLKPLLEAPMVWQFAIVTACAQLLGQVLPDKLMALRTVLAVLAVLPLLGAKATWLGAWHQTLAVVVGLLTATLTQAALRLPADGNPGEMGCSDQAAKPAEPETQQPEAQQAEPPRSQPQQAQPQQSQPQQAGPPRSQAQQAGPPNQQAESQNQQAEPQTETQRAESQQTETPASGRTIEQRLADPFFWRKLVVAMLALSIGLGVGATNPKYLYFGVVLLLGESIGATLERVRDRMLGVSLGVLMPWLVFNTFSIHALSVALVMGGTTALLITLKLSSHLRTALISSGVTFVGYGALTDWYIPTRWLDYLMGCGLALLVCLLVRPVSALRRFQILADGATGMTTELQKLLPSALEEARLLGQERQLNAWVVRLEGEGGGQINA